jgi:hypothetical protein
MIKGQGNLAFVLLIILTRTKNNDETVNGLGRRVT